MIARRLQPAMRARIACLKVITLGVLVGALEVQPARAHHSWARYDGDHVFTVAGVITAIEWTNPHVIMRFTSKDESNQSTEWTMEMDPPT